MNFELIREFLLWSTLLNYGVLIIWFLVFHFAHHKLYQLHMRWFSLSISQFDALHYAGMTVYKIGILLFNLVPFIALCLARSLGA